MRLLIVDDHEVVRRGVRSLLADRAECEVCGEAIDGQDAVDKARELNPEIVVMDVSMPRLNGLEATRQLRSILPDSEVLILSQHDAPEMARQALKAGARGYVVKSSIGRDLLVALQKVSKGEYFFDPAILDQNTASHVDVQEILQRSAAFEEALRENEELYRSTFELTPVGVAHVAPDGKWLRVNQRLCEIVGYSEAELLKMTFQEITHPDNLAADLEQAEKIRTGELQAYSMEKRYVRKDGSLVWGHLTVSGARDKEGKLKYFISVVEDIGERKRIEEELRHAQERTRFSLEAAKIGTWEYDLKTGKVEWSSNMEAVHGQAPGSFGKSFESFLEGVYVDDREPVKQQIQRALAGEGSYHNEYRQYRADGSLGWMEAQGRVVFDEAGKPARMFGVCADVTERKSAQDATGLLAAIVASSDDAIISKTLAGVITSWNRGAEKLFGYSAAEAIGQHITLIVPSNRNSEESDILLRLSRGEKIDHFETVRQRKDGSQVEVSVTISPVKDAEGRTVGASNVSRDITAKRQSDRALAKGARQQRALFHLADELHRAGSMGEIYNAALNAILDALQCNRASILLCDDAGVMRFRSWRNLSNDYRAAVDGHSAWRPGEKNPQPVCITDIVAADLTESLKATVKKEGIAALAFIPLLSDGMLIGKFMAYFNAPHQFSEHELDLSLTIARQLAFAISRKSNEEELQRSEERFRRLSETLDAEVSRQTAQVRKLTHDLLRAQDEERRHIARELHDSAGQTLAVLGMNLAQLGHDAARSAPVVAKKIEDVQELVQQLHREIRTTSYLLHPPLLDENGLPSALNWYVQGLAERSSLMVKLDIEDQFGRLASEVELAIFRFVQECLTNVHRHSGSSTASIRLAHDGDIVRVEVADQGKGIPPQRLMEIQAGGSGVGIRGMQERLRQFGGTVSIQSSESGTVVRASVPGVRSAQAEEKAPVQAAV